MNFVNNENCNLYFLYFLTNFGKIYEKYPSYQLVKNF